MMIRLAALLFAALTLAGCAMLQSQTTPAAPAPPDPKTQMGALETRIAFLVEEERHKLDPKAKSLAMDPELSRIARARASDMAAGNYLAHAAPDGETSASLLMKQDAQWQGLLGENLAAQHYTKEGGVAVDDFARRFLDEWLKSPPHRDNMAFVDYDHAGVGAAVNGDTVYVAVLFSTDMGLKGKSAGLSQGPSKGTSANTVTTLASPAEAKGSSTNSPATPPSLRGAEGLK